LAVLVAGGLGLSLREVPPCPLRRPGCRPSRRRRRPL